MGGDQINNVTRKLSDDEIKFVMNALRQASIKWEGRRECLNRARKRVRTGTSKEGNARFKYYWQCGKCLNWYRNEKDVEVDHILEIGPYNGDWNEYVLKVFCGQDNLQCLCIGCHMKKTMQYNSARTRWERKKPRP